MDYRSLNAATVPLAYPMPRVDTLLHWVAKRKFYTAIDVIKAFHQIPIDPKSRKYCAFATPRHSLTPLVMQFGLRNAAQTFQKYLDAVFRGTAPLPEGVEKPAHLPSLHDIVRAYIDDIVIASDTREEHIKNIYLVLERLQLYQLTCHPLADQPVVTEVDLLGYTISQGKILPHEDKIQGLTRLTVPKTVKQARQQLGMLSYYRSAICHFALLAQPLYKFANGQPVDQAKVHRAHSILLKALKDKTALTVPDGQDLRIHVDASNIGFGAALTRSDNTPIAFVSKTWKTQAQQSYAPYKMELYALMYALTRWRHFCEGHTTHVHSDHLPLVRKGITDKTQKEDDRTVVRWLSQVQGLDIHLHYIKGADNIVADYLSRIPEDITSCNHLTAAQAKTVHALWHVNGPTTVKNVLDSGYKCTSADLLALNKASDECIECQQHKEPRKKGGLPRSVEIPTQPWQHLAMDFLHLDGRSEHVILVVLDRYTKFCELIPCKLTDTATEIAELLWEHIILRYGVPMSVMTDRDTRFTAHVFQDILAEHQIMHRLTSPYHHVGSVERLHRTLRTIDNILVNLQSNYADRVDTLQFFYNTRVHSATGVSPYRALMNYSPAATSLKRFFPESKQVTFDELRTSIDKRLRSSADKIKTRMATRRNGWVPEVNSYVLLSTQNWRERMRKSRYNKYVGPFRVTKAYEYDNFALDLPARWRQRNIFHASLLKPWRGKIPSTPYGEIDGKFLIDKILEWRTDRTGQRTHGKVQWLNYPSTDATWEPVAELTAFLPS